MVKQDQFEGMIQRLIGYNEAIKAFLHISEIRKLRMMQHQAFMTTLQLNSKIEEWKEISLAIHVPKKTKKKSACKVYLLEIPIERDLIVIKSQGCDRSEAMYRGLRQCGSNGKMIMETVCKAFPELGSCNQRPYHEPCRSPPFSSKAQAVPSPTMHRAFHRWNSWRMPF